MVAVEISRIADLSSETVTVSSWNPARTKFVAGGQSGWLTVRERHDLSEPAGPLRLVASWQAGSGPVTQIEWVPPEFGSKIAVVTDDSSSVTIWGEGERNEGGRKETRNVSNGVHDADMDMEGAEEEALPGGRFQGGSRKTKSGTWGECARLDCAQPSSGKNGKEGGDQEAAGDGASAAVLACCFVQSVNTDPLMMAAVTASGRLLVFTTSDPLSLRDWSLESNVPLFLQADLHVSKPLISSAVMAPHPACYLPGQQPAIGIATESDHEWGRTLQLWVFSSVFSRWHTAADFLADCSFPYSTFNSLSFAPSAGRPFDLLAVASDEAVNIFKVSYGERGKGAASGLKISIAAVLKDFGGEVAQVLWDSIGDSLMTASYGGEVKVWKQSIAGEWIGDVISTPR